MEQPCYAVLLLEQIGMSSHTFENQPAAIDLVDEHPIRLDMAITAPDVVSCQFVIAVDGVQWLSGEQRPGKNLEFLQILAASLGALDVPLELSGVDRRVHQIPSLSNMSSASSQRTRSRPASVALSVRVVVAVGTATSNGRPLRSSTCL